MKKIFITRCLPSIAKELLSRHFAVDENTENKPISSDELLGVVKEYDAVLSTIVDKFTKEVLNNSKIEVISNYAVGLDNIDLISAKERGIAVYNTPDVVTNSTADLTFALLLSFIRKISSAQNFVKENKWSSWDPELFLGEELSGKTFGIIGFGKIGKAVAKRAESFGLKVIYYNRSKVDSDYKLVELDYLLENSDYVSIHIPLTPETKKFINSSAFDKMKKKPILLNMARGSIVDTEALLSALKTGKIRGACLDVADPEPLSSAHELCHLENCLIVPHIGTATLECRHNMAKLAAENIINHFAAELRLEKEIERKLNLIFKEVMNLEFSLNLSKDNWDSLKQIQLITEIEKKFGIEIKFKDFLKMTDSQQIMEVIKNYLEAKKLMVKDEMLLPHQRIGSFFIDYKNIGDLFKAKLNEIPEKTFIIFPDRDKEYTYQQFYDKYSQISRFLQQNKINKGDRINLIIPTSPEFVLMYFAALSMGVTIVPINPDLSPEEMGYIIKDSKAKVVFYSRSLEDKIKLLSIYLKVTGRNSTIKPVFESVETFCTLASESNSPIAITGEVQLTDEAVVIYTSGTTGNPKGAVLTHLNLLSDAKAISEWFCFTANSRTLCILPLFHNNGQIITLLTPLYSGGSTVMVQGKASLMSFWKLVEKYNIHWTSVMPSILSILLSMPFERKDNSMAGIICGGQILIREVQNKFEQRFKVPIFEGFGLTETTSFACFNDFPADKRKEGSVGKALPVNKIVILDEEDKELKPYDEGEIAIKGLNVVNEYLGLTEKNKQAFRNGWFHSGDYGYLDEQGYVYFRTRKDFLIIKSGENIYPSEIENVLYKHPEVEETAVIGIPCKLLGEDICAFVKVKDGSLIKEKELREFISGKIAGYKQPKEIIIINNLPDLNEIPKGPTKKVLYRKLKEYYTNNFIKSS